MRMKKVLIVFLVMLLFGTFVLGSQSITNYKVSPRVSMGLNATATGLFEDTNGAVSGQLCSFYFYDLNGVLIVRATDQYSSGTGRFTMVGFPVTEPTFKRGQSYTLRSECASASADQNFIVAQRETISAPASQEFEYITNPENVDTLFIWGAFFIFVLFVLGIITLLWKLRR